VWFQQEDSFDEWHSLRNSLENNTNRCETQVCERKSNDGCAYSKDGQSAA